MTSDSEIQDILIDRVDTRREAVGIVVGVIDPLGRRVIAHGSFGKGDPRPLAGNTLFEVGSVTKVFTALLLTGMAERAELAVDDPAAQYLPAGVTLPQRGGRQITLIDLATHTSGLPRLPPNFSPKDGSNPYADFTVADLYGALSSYELTRDIGTQFEYSNLGFGLLGHVLERCAGRRFAELLRDRIFTPLGMADTAISLTDDQQARLAVGHNATLDPVSNWDVPALAGAGALRSTANDLLTFLSAVLGYIRTPLESAIAALLSVRRATGTPRLQTALGWQILGERHEIVWKNGGTGGYAALVGFDPRTHLGVVVLSNTFAVSGALVGVDDIGLHLLKPTVPLNRPSRQRTNISPDPEQIDTYVGQYRLLPTFVISVLREGTRLFAQATGQPRFEIFPESECEFFAAIGDIQIRFDTDERGRATLLQLRQGGEPFPPAPRINN